jgi:DNA-binding NarL/FixJ family response regulator
MLRILIADDHPLLRRGARAILEEHEGWEVCAEASNGKDAVELAMRLHPDLCVLDVSMPELDGIEATRRIRAALPNTEVVVLTVHDSEELPAAILAAGARGYVLKDDLADDLTAAVESVARHARFFTRKVAQPAAATLEGRPASRGDGMLTRREREIVQLVAQGWRTARIAAHLGIGEKTVETHRAAILRKLHLKSVADVVRFAIRNGIANP